MLRVLVARAQGDTDTAVDLFGQLDTDWSATFGQMCGLAAVVASALPDDGTSTIVEVDNIEGGVVPDHMSLAAALIAATANRDTAGAHAVAMAADGETCGRAMAELLDMATAVVRDHMRKNGLEP